MKRHHLLIAAVIICTALISCTFNLNGESFGGETVKGNGNIVTRNYDVTAFNEISASLPATVNFTVSDHYTCTVTVDENLFDYLEIKVKDNDLHLRKSNEHKNVRLDATEFVIEVSAPSVEDINLAGSGTFKALSPLNGKKLDVNVAGSGDIYFQELVTVDKIELNVAGSGTLVCENLVAESLDGNIAGSGDLMVRQGAVKKAEVSVAGSGDIDLACDIDTLEADIAGSGDIVAKVNGTLEYNIIGSGDIKRLRNAHQRAEALMPL